MLGRRGRRGQRGAERRGRTVLKEGEGYGFRKTAEREAHKAVQHVLIRDHLGADVGRLAVLDDGDAGNSPGGVNLTVWIIDKNIHPHRFGVPKAQKAPKKEAEGPPPW